MPPVGAATDSIVGNWRPMSMAYKDATTGAVSDLWGA